MAKRAKNKGRNRNIYDKYRQILKMPDLTNKEIDEMRKYISLIAQTICEYVWGKKFY